ncbi:MULTISPECIES: AAA family ATPase [unclassified Marinobacter]|jgi:predicted ATP-binding protein involved in virulence|uniref:AAA family ATPase n=1 Tax=unclassified Marinobacter TaxID=83889 RepID=UPI0018F1F350|nr:MULTISPECIES: AAA family ATPase [unclassified Marinobacter]UZD66579.1 AAA family ATPase [Marinobacter sp. AN1]
MRLDKLRLKNFRCFSEIELELNDKLTVLVAENGQGKSALLDAIRIALWPYVSSFDLARPAFTDPSNNISINDVRLVRMPNNDMARQLPTEIAMKGDFGAGKSETWVRYRDSEAKSTKTKEREATSKLKNWANSIQSQIRNPEKPVLDLPVFGYYGTGRLWSPKRLMPDSRLRDNSRDSDFYIRTFAYQNCLDPASTYKHFKKWFIWAYESLNEQLLRDMKGHSNEGELRQAQDRVQVVQRVIDTFLKPITGWHTLEYSITREHSLILHHDEQGTLDVEQLSDGIRSMLAMVGDIAYRCIKLNPQLGAEAAQQTTGVVMIDEVDMHLHPRWQQVVLGQLREAFPKVQFIVTTHSPQVLTTVARGFIRVLRADENGISVEVPEFSPLAHESGDALAQIMGTQREPELPLQDDIRAFEQLVRAGQEASAEAQEMRAKLEQAGYQFHESDLTTWRFLAERKKNRES